MAHVYSDNPELERRIRRGLLKGRIVRVAVATAVALFFAGCLALSLEFIADAFFPTLSRRAAVFVAALLGYVHLRAIDRYIQWRHPMDND